MHEWTTSIESVRHKIIGCPYDSKLDWNDHINIVRNKIAKNVSVMNRVKHVLTSSALYSLYCTLVMPYLTYCCEVWGNNYKTRIHSLFILQKRAIRICLNTDYKCHTKPLFYQLRSLNTLSAKDGDLRLSASNACLPKTEISVFVTECVFFTSTCYKLHVHHCTMCYTVRKKKCSSLFWYKAILIWFSQFIMTVVQN